ncbi:MAG: hypothetical protein N2662_12605 [Bacteroidales bacterium]|nr:hypothetical protein [Bacteroidales bacterium]
MMYTLLLQSHSLLRYALLIFIVATLIKAFWGLRNNLVFDRIADKLSFFTVLAAHLQFLTGIILYWISPILKWGRSYSGSWMSDTFLRYWMLEHLVGMLVAIVFITLGRILTKKTSIDVQKYKRLFLFFLLALILIIIMIPWPFRPVIGRSWF